MEPPYDEFAIKFMPKKIKYLLIGESPPVTAPGDPLKYFYNPDDTKRQLLLASVSYAFLYKKYNQRLDNKTVRLKELQANQVFLLDATYEQINQLRKRQRIEKIKEAYPRLKRYIEDLPLGKKVKTLVLHSHVVTAIGYQLKDHFSSSYHEPEPLFPRYYYDPRFVSRIKDALG